mgnify:CR=1 FL=1
MLRAVASLVAVLALPVNAPVNPVLDTLVNPANVVELLPNDIAVVPTVTELLDSLALAIDPANIVGSSQLWVFNTKTRKLGVYNSQDSGGLSVKGTSLLNYDETTSIQKTIRKPETVLPNCLKGGKIILRKLLPEINAVEQPLTGRINSDTILLRVIK